VLLAKLFTRATNVLVLDEPTNDLDVETLEALEHRLEEYDGTLIVVSHDRHFLDSVVTATLVFEAEGEVRRYAGGYSDWARNKHALAVIDEPRAAKAAAATRVPPPRSAPAGKLSYKLQRELDALPSAIEQLEADVAGLRARVAAPDFYRGAADDIRDVLATLERSEQELERAIDRWAELEQQAERLARNRP
jgi:ATP-binding cassette subfamily F protein uup